MTVDHRGGDVDQLAVGGARVVTKHLERGRLVHRVAFHEDALGPLGDGPVPEGPFQVLVLGEAAQDDVDRALPILGVGVADVGEDASCGLPGEARAASSSSTSSTRRFCSTPGEGGAAEDSPPRMQPRLQRMNRGRNAP
jgi:hypothetical protein